jgi:hypothetical protein
MSDSLFLSCGGELDKGSIDVVDEINTVAEDHFELKVHIPTRNELHCLPPA